MIFVAGFPLQNDGVIPFLPPQSQEENLSPRILYCIRQNELIHVYDDCVIHFT